MAWYNNIFGRDESKLKKKKAYRRSYSGASTGRLFADFITRSTRNTEIFGVEKNNLIFCIQHNLLREQEIAPVNEVNCWND